MSSSWCYAPDWHEGPSTRDQRGKMLLGPPSSEVISLRPTKSTIFVYLKYCWFWVKYQTMFFKIILGRWCLGLHNSKYLVTRNNIWRGKQESYIYTCQKMSSVLERLRLEWTSGSHLIQSRARLEKFAPHYDIIMFFYTHLLSQF